MKLYSLLLLCLFILCFGEVTAQRKDMILLEAENFANKGGWVVDQQFMDQMGSPFLLAHGLGTPVKEASTIVRIPKNGMWHVFVRTWNWCSPWKVKEAPGRFRVKIDGTDLENDLGTGKQWGWEYAGSLNLKTGNSILSLSDLTGFDGRCDAILLSSQKEIKLPEGKEELYAFRKKMLGLPNKPENGGQYDLVVVGGGIAGICTALKASREGMKVALINDRPVWGGNNSMEIKVVVSGKLNCDPYPQLGTIVKEIGNIYEHPSRIDSLVKVEKNLSCFLNAHVFKVDQEGNEIRSVTAKHVETSKETVFFAPLFVDCTGDGNLGFLAGADFRIGQEARRETRETLAPEQSDNYSMGATIRWRSEWTSEKVDFPACNWAIQFDEESCEKVTRGTGFWETGFLYDQVNDAEYIRDYLFRAVFGNWAFLKNKSKDKSRYEKLRLVDFHYIAGKRESRRLMGDVFFKQQDIEKEFTQYDDAIVTGTYSIDRHFPIPKHRFYFPGEEFISTMKHNFNDLGTPRRYLRDDQVNPPYRIPYRCFYSRNIKNLFMAGRNISVTHIALASTRVQGTTGMMGEVVGLAAALCKKYDCLPRDIYTDHLNELLERAK